MSSKQIRVILRYAHLIEGALIAIYIYVPTAQQSALFTALIQFIVLPFIIISGLMLWQQPRINKWRKQWGRAS